MMDESQVFREYEIFLAYHHYYCMCSHSVTVIHIRPYNVEETDQFFH